MQLTKADLMDGMRAPTSTEEVTDEPVEALGQRACVRLSIEEICNGTWSIGGKLTITVADRVSTGE